VRTDLFTGLYSAEYLYGKGKQTIDKYTSSTVCMFNITNIEEINQNYSRKTGNNTIIEIGNLIKTSISSEYIFVRYMGTKFVIVFSGVEPEAVIEFLKETKKNIEELAIKYIPDKPTKKVPKKEITVSPTINMILSTYYKGTAMEGVTR